MHRQDAPQRGADPKLPDAQHPVPEQNPVPGWLFSTALLLWWIAGYGLVVYSLVEDRGPFAFLLSWQDRLFGGSSLIIAAGIAAIVIFPGPGWLIRGLHRLWPTNPVITGLNSRMRQAMRSRHQIANDARARWVEADWVEKARIARRGRRTGLIMAAAAFGLSLAVHVWVHVEANADAGEPLTPITVSSEHPIDLGKASDWVRVENGIPLRDAILARDYTIRGHAYRDYYTPIVPADWTKGERIYLLEKDMTSPGDQDAQDSPDPPGSIEGELSVAGPRDDVGESFQRHGYDVGPWTAVLRRQFGLDGKIPGEDSTVVWIIWVEGGLFVTIGLLVAAVQHSRLRRVLALES